MYRLLILLAVVVVSGCAGLFPPEIPYDPVVGVADPARMFADDSVATNLQAKHFAAMAEFAKKLPYRTFGGSIGFAAFKDKMYFNIGLLGGTYNTIRTTCTTRLSNEFFEKYQAIIVMIMREPFSRVAPGIAVTLSSLSYNFVTGYATSCGRDEIVIRSDLAVVKAFVGGDITAQKLLNESVVFVNRQRVDFKLESM